MTPSIGGDRNDFLRLSTTQRVEVEIMVDVRDFHARIQDALLRQIRQRYEGQCLVEYGYILKIARIVKIVQHQLGSLIPHLHVRAIVKAITFLPKVGMKLKIGIEMIFTHGIFCHWEKIRILVPVIHLDGWILVRDFTGCHLVSSQCPSQTLHKGDPVSIIMQDIRFEKDGYSCIATLDDQEYPHHK